MPDNDQELIKRYRQGDLDAFDILYQRHRKGVYLRALRMVKDKEESLDIVQECFIRVWKKRRRFRQGKRFSPWLYQIATNLCLDYLRKRPPGKLVSLSEPVGNPHKNLFRQVADNSSHPAQALAHNELKEKLREAISSLPLKFEEVFILRYIEGVSCKDTAKALDCSERTVKWRLAQAKSLVQRKMMPYLKDEVEEEGSRGGASVKREREIPSPLVGESQGEGESPRKGEESPLSSGGKGSW